MQALAPKEAPLPLEGARLHLRAGPPQPAALPHLPPRPPGRSRRPKCPSCPCQLTRRQVTSVAACAEDYRKGPL